MRKLNDIAADLRAVLGGAFRTVRLTAMQTADQFAQELRSINPEKLPGVIVAYDGGAFRNENTVAESRFTLIVVDRFKADSDDRVLSLFQAAETLLTLFPLEGITRQGVFYLPEDCAAATPDRQYACLAIGIVAKQGT